MKNGMKGNLILNGYGSSNGGHFNEVKLNGRGIVNGDLECVLFECNGSGTVKGDLKIDRGKISGSGKIKGGVNGNDFTIEGHGSVSEGVSLVNKMNISGSGKIGGSLRADEIKIKGKATIATDCETESFQTEGQFAIGGLLSADHIDVKLYGESSALEIGGQTIKIKGKKRGFFHLFKPFFPAKLTADVIEGDELELESTNAKIVRGKNVTIGPECEIDLVEYKESIHLDDAAKVREFRKI
ncbi:cytoplasmic protein [Fictibacillus fluitans]|uniref:Cytoplasmic protein n=1 Tax=Fictibacillus fluitans TaxID=3058422 RepID=A0ABT8HVE2_9BACL|nr:cytoplasmic protein [Fictibacillus sp. NE201]MDN4524465.1 cytoplasmic protein [Fictibacillus sp. NE201]